MMTELQNWQWAISAFLLAISLILGGLLRRKNIGKNGNIFNHAINDAQIPISNSNISTSDDPSELTEVQQQLESREGAT